MLIGRSVRIVVSVLAVGLLSACGPVAVPSSSTPAATVAAAASVAVAPPVAPRLAAPDPQIAVRSELIAPKDTDPAIDIALEPHYVAFASVAKRARLFVFLATGGSTADEYRLITDQAARNGFHAISLRYPNTTAIQALCGTDTDTSCFEKTRLETIDGTDRSPKVTVNRANSIENRLLKLLAYLDGKHPGEGWAGYVEGGAPKWASMVVAGHAQGGGHAALIARDHVVDRVAMFSAPVDHLGAPGRQIGSSQPAPWLLGAHLTPSDRYYSFGHVGDENNVWELQWKALGLGLTTFGPSVSVDTSAPPYGGSHLLTTAAQPRPSSFNLPNQGSTAIDVATPLTSAGQPAYAQVWQYMCFQ